MRALSRCQKNPPRSGQVAALVVLSLAVIIGVVAINMDGGRMLEERRRVQAAADSAALAAGANLYANYWTNKGLDTNGTAKTAALNAAAAYGLSASSVTVNIPPQSGTFAGQSGYAEVIIKSDLNATFGQIFTSNELPVSGRSVARGQPMNLGLLLLQPSGAGAFTNKALAFTMINAPIIVNSTDSSAYEEPVFGITIASRFNVTGGVLNSGGALLLGPMFTGVSATPDPLEFLPVPSTSGVPVQSATPMTINSLLPTVLSPGIYQGGLHITGASVVVMQPGVYIMQGGGFQVDGAATVAALQVMVYNTTSSTYAAGSISVTSVGKVVMAAPLSGTYQGLNFFQDRSLTNPITMTGVGLAAITGVVYAVSAPANLTGLATVGLDILGGAFVVSSMTVQGAGTININLNLNPPRIPDVRLVE